jgi:two-component sensor histidine kinase
MLYLPRYEQREIPSRDRQTPPDPGPGLPRMSDTAPHAVNPALRLTIETVTPDRAAFLLRAGRPGAPEDGAAIARYGDAMREGRWLLNGMPLVLSQSGQVLDGVQRLLACIRSATPFPSFVARDVAEDAAHSIDQHRRRTPADLLAIRGVSHPQAMAALVLRLIRYQDGTLARARAPVPEWDRLDRVLRGNPGLHRALAASLAMPDCILAEPVRSAILFMGSAVDPPGDPGAPARLLLALQNPGDFPANEPGVALHAAIATAHQARSAGPGQLTLFAWGVLALDATLQGRRLAALAWGPGTPFPTLSFYPGLAEAPPDRAPAGAPTAGLPAPSAAVARIGPQTAAAYLAASQAERTIVHAHVAALARDVAAGHWRLNGQPICFAISGRLLNGRHRLMAVVAAGRPIDCVLVRGLADATDVTFDIQGKRPPLPPGPAGGFGDQPLLAAMANLLLRDRSPTQPANGPGGRLPASGKATATEIRRVLEDHPRLVELRGFARRMTEFGHASVLGYAAFLIEREDPARGAAFLRGLETGADLPAGSPLLALRSQLLRSRQAHAAPQAQLTMVMAAWRRYREQAPPITRSVTTLSQPATQATPPPYRGTPKMQTPATTSSHGASPGDPATQLQRRTDQHTILAAFGRFALGARDMDDLMQEAARLAAKGLGAGFSKVLEHEAGTDMLLLRAGIGWRDGAIGVVRLPPGATSPAGYAFATGAPTVSNDLSADHRFGLPPLLADHGIRREVNVVIRGEGPPFGVLEVDDTAPGLFSSADISFLEALANTLGLALERKRDIAERERLLAERGLLLAEVHHRVRNSLQLVHTVLTLQANDAEDAEARRLLDLSALRVMTIAAVHERLYQGERFDAVEMRGYMLSLIEALRAGLVALAPGRSVALEAETGAFWPPQRAQVLGMVLAELVTNALKYGSGEIRVRFAVSDMIGRLEVEDDGAGLPEGFEPQSGGGLGMRIVRELLRGQGGRLTVVPGATGAYLRADFPPPHPER